MPLKSSLARPLAASVILALVFRTGLVCGQEAIETAQALAWDYAPHAEVGFFRVYLSQTSGSYPGYIPTRPQDGRPEAIAPAIPELVLQIAAQAVMIRLTTPGVWYAIVTAVNLEISEESDPSPELSFTYRHRTPVPPLPGPPIPPPVVPPILPPPLAWPGLPPPVVIAPGPSTRLLSDQRRRIREQAPTPLPSVSPGGTLSDYRRCLAQGTCPK